MKKFLLSLTVLLMCCIAIMSFVACNTMSLSAPTRLTVDQDTLVLSWRAVKQAQMYTVSINGEEKNTGKNSYPLEKLEVGEYSIKVKAVSLGEYKDSAWSETFNFVREQESGLVFKLINNKTEYEVSDLGKAGSDVVVPDEFRGRPVTAIGDKAFANKSQLKSITFGKNITKIGAQAFYNCTYLTDLKIPEQVTYIGAQAFQSCAGLTGNFVIPNGVTEIFNNTFSYCRGITQVEIGSGVTAIGEYAFSDCSGLTEIVIPDSVTSIGAYAFTGCTSAKTLTCGRNIRNIGERAFNRCIGLTEIEFGPNLENIGKCAFYDCTALTSVNLPDNVQVLEQGVFENCAELADVTLGSGVKSIGIYAFYKTKLWETQDVAVYADKWLVDVKDREIVSFDAFWSKDICGIAGYAFSECTALETIFIPNSVQVVDQFAFANCKGLVNLALGSGVKSVGKMAFLNCETLQNLSLGEYDLANQKQGESSLQNIENNAFEGCKSLMNVEIPDTVTHIGSYAFYNTGLWNIENVGVVYAGNWAVGYKGGETLVLVVALEEGTIGISDYAFYNSVVMSVTLPESLKYIGRAAFYNCVMLSEVNMPENCQVEKIEDYTFYKCYSLAITTLPNSIKSIGRSAFYQCKALGSDVSADDTPSVFTIPDSVETVGEYAFYGCGTVTVDDNGTITDSTGVQKLVVGNGVTEIGANAFNKIATLQEVEMGDNVLLLGDKAFYKCEKLEKVKLSASLVAINDKTFYGCTALKEIVLPDSVQFVGNYAFYKCAALQNVQLGSNVNQIGNYAFYGCTALENINLNKVASIGKHCFRNNTSLASVVLSKNLTAVDNYAFYGCSQITFYVENENSEGWAKRWNASYRPAVWGVTLSQNNEYVVSFVKTEQSISSSNSFVAISAPQRRGYVFAGWATEQNGNVVFDMANLISAENGTVLYAVWEVENNN